MEQTKKTIVWLAAFLAIVSIDVLGKPFAVGPYLGQTPPGPVAQVFAPGLICDMRPRRWESHGQFSADGNTFCFMRGTGVFITENTDQGWTAPEHIKSIPWKWPRAIHISLNHPGGDPGIAPDESFMVFTSS